MAARVGEADAWLDRAITWMDANNVDKPKDSDAGTHLHWYQRVELQTLRSEAAALTRPKKP